MHLVAEFLLCFFVVAKLKLVLHSKRVFPLSCLIISLHFCHLPLFLCFSQYIIVRGQEIVLVFQAQHKGIRFRSEPSEEKNVSETSVSGIGSRPPGAVFFFDR